MVEITQETYQAGKKTGFDLKLPHEKPHHILARYIESYPHGNMERFDYHEDSPDLTQ